jgi:hypothetical protein
MPKYKAEAGTQINGVDQDGNVWPEPLVFGKDGTLTVPDDQQDVVTALEGAVGAGAIKRVSSGKE